MPLTYKGQSKYWKNMYVASGLSDRIISAEGDYVFALQGDDTLSLRTLSGAVLVGGSGNDTYVSSDLIRGEIFDAGGGIDTLVLEGKNSSDFFDEYMLRKATQSHTAFQLNGHKLETVKTTHSHLQIYRDDDIYISEELFIYEFDDARSAIDLIKFDDVTITIQDFINTAITKGVYSEGDNLASSSSTLTAMEHNSSSLEMYENQTTFESQAVFNRDSYLEDVSSIGRLYQASFNRVPDGGGLNDWVHYWENGWELSNIAEAFLQSEEFKTLYGEDSTNENYVLSLYNNTLGREPDAEGYNSWLGVLNNEVMTRADLLVHFSDSAENIERTQELFSQLSFDGNLWQLPESNLNSTTSGIDYIY